MIYGKHNSGQYFGLFCQRALALLLTAYKLSEFHPNLQEIMRPTTDIEANTRSSISSHILPTSANLVGACIMSLSLVMLLPRHEWAAWVDEILAYGID